ncbi:HAD family hydrolase [bacterium]|nr:MAG: HAD family hydrolase [bacterium]
MAYRFIYFDLDDTLLNHRKAEKLALADIWQEFELNKLVTIEQLQETYHHINVFLWEMYGRGEIDRDELQRTRFERTLFRIESTSSWQEVGDRYMERYQEHWTWIKGAQKAFETIKKHYPVGILTNGFAETQRIKLKKFNLDTPEIKIVISEDVGIMKPQAGIFEAATTISGFQSNEILYVGDSYSSDVLGGSGFGWDVAWFTNETDADKLALTKLHFNDFQQLLDFLNIAD